jgi:hypothetical protein
MGHVNSSSVEAMARRGAFVRVYTCKRKKNSGKNSPFAHERPCGPPGPEKGPRDETSKKDATIASTHSCAFTMQTKPLSPVYTMQEPSSDLSMDLFLPTSPVYVPTRTPKEEQQDNCASSPGDATPDVVLVPCVYLVTIVCRRSHSDPSLHNGTPSWMIQSSRSYPSLEEATKYVALFEVFEQNKCYVQRIRAGNDEAVYTVQPMEQGVPRMGFPLCSCCGKIYEDANERTEAHCVTCNVPHSRLCMDCRKPLYTCQDAWLDNVHVCCHCAARAQTNKPLAATSRFLVSNARSSFRAASIAGLLRPVDQRKRVRRTGPGQL